MIRLKLTPNQQRRFLVGVFCFMGLIVWVNVFLLPQQKKFAESSFKVQKLKPQVALARQKLVQLPHVEAEIARLSAVHKLPSVRPLEEQLPQLLDLISQTAHSARVRLQAVKPLKEDLSHLMPGPSGFIELSLRVETVSGYDELTQFLHALETSEILVRVKALEIKADPKNFQSHPVTLLLEAYLPPLGYPSS